MASDDKEPLSPGHAEGVVQFGLTAQERRVLALSATRRGVTDVAIALHEPPDAVRRLLRSAITKLRARSKLEAVIIALREGLIDLNDNVHDGDGMLVFLFLPPCAATLAAVAALGAV
jgi:DNA-binding CsgD family transcriptional regulator